jgi:hypothetical protein
VIAKFLQDSSWGAADCRPLAGDASFRRYHRLTLGGRRAVLMDAPPPQEDVRPFLHIAGHLTALGYSAPRVEAADSTAGLLLLEDLGDDTFTRLLAAGADEEVLYRLAVDLLIDLHGRGAAALPEGLPPYDDQRLLREVQVLTEWYYPEVMGAPLPDAARQDYVALWRELLPVARQVPETLVLFDFHVDNLLRLEGRRGVAACGLLDFQDAVAGPLTYDLMSLLEDARRDMDPAMVARLRQRYLEAFPGLERTAFDASWAAMAAQRHSRVIGVFARLNRRDGKPAYLRHIPRVWRLLETALAHPALAALKDWLDRQLPPQRRVAPAP